MENKSIKLTGAILFVFLFAFNCFGQTKPDANDKAIVYVYSLATSSTMGRVHPSVFLDDKEIAQIRPAHFFIARIDPGKHSFHFKQTKKRGGIEMEFEAGKTYYLRVGWKAEATVRPEGIDIVSKEAADYDIKHARPVDENNLIDKQIAFTKIE